MRIEWCRSLRCHTFVYRIDIYMNHQYYGTVQQTFNQEIGSIGGDWPLIYVYDVYTAKHFFFLSLFFLHKMAIKKALEEYRFQGNASFHFELFGSFERDPHFFRNMRVI